MDPALLALVGTVAGTIGLRVIEHWLTRGKVKIDDAARIRDELRMEVTSQREEIKQLETDAVKWRNEYYDLRDKYIQLQTELTLALRTLQDEAKAAAIKAEQIHKQPPEIE